MGAQSPKDLKRGSRHKNIKHKMKNKTLGVNAPKQTCTDKKCPFHGSVSVKNEIFKGRVIRKDSTNSATIEWFKSFPVKKYERHEIRRYRLHAHNPRCISAQIGQNVICARTRPLSKTKNVVILKILDEGELILPAIKEQEKASKDKKTKSKDEDLKQQAKIESQTPPSEEQEEQDQ
jgi:small subunit ribosomal protein S17